MSSSESSPEWVLSVFLSRTEPPIQDDICELTIVARRLWPRVQAHARKLLTNEWSEDAIVLATDVWEAVLRSVAKTMHRSAGRDWQTLNLEAYLFGIFNHRFNRAMRKERRRRESHLPLNHDLQELRQALDSTAVADLDRSVQLKQAIESMDKWTGMTEAHAKVRFGYEIGRLRARFGIDATDVRRLDPRGCTQYADRGKLGPSF
jgi:hypothetical protein